MKRQDETKGPGSAAVLLSSDFFDQIFLNGTVWVKDVTKGVDMETARFEG